MDGGGRGRKEDRRRPNLQPRRTLLLSLTPEPRHSATPLNEALGTLYSPFHSPSALARPGRRAENGLVERWARLGSNQRPPACEAGADGDRRGPEGRLSDFWTLEGGRIPPRSPTLLTKTHQSEPC